MEGYIFVQTGRCIHNHIEGTEFAKYFYDDSLTKSWPSNAFSNQTSHFPCSEFPKEQSNLCRK